MASPKIRRAQVGCTMRLAVQSQPHISGTRLHIRTTGASTRSRLLHPSSPHPKTPRSPPALSPLPVPPPPPSSASPWLSCACAHAVEAACTSGAQPQQPQPCPAGWLWRGRRRGRQAPPPAPPPPQPASSAPEPGARWQWGPRERSALRGHTGAPCGGSYIPAVGGGCMGVGVGVAVCFSPPCTH